MSPCRPASFCFERHGGDRILSQLRCFDSGERRGIYSTDDHELWARERRHTCQVISALAGNLFQVSFDEWSAS